MRAMSARHQFALEAALERFGSVGPRADIAQPSIEPSCTQDYTSFAIASSIVSIEDHRGGM
jgi:hypothetical protein